MLQQLVIAAAGLIVAFVITLGLIALCQFGLDELATKLDRPIPDPDEDMEWAGEIGAGGPLSRAVRKAIGRHLVAERYGALRLARQRRRVRRGGASS